MFSWNIIKIIYSTAALALISNSVGVKYWKFRENGLFCPFLGKTGKITCACKFQGEGGKCPPVTQALIMGTYFDIFVFLFEGLAFTSVLLQIWSIGTPSYASSNLTQPIAVI